MRKTLLLLFAIALFAGEGYAQCSGQKIDNLTGGSSQHHSVIMSSWAKHEFNIIFPSQYWNTTIKDPVLYYRLMNNWGSKGNNVNGGFTDGDDGAPLVTFVNSVDISTTPPNTNQTDTFHVFDFTGQNLTIPSNGEVWFRFNYVSGNNRAREDIGTNAHTTTYQQNDIVRPGFTSFAVYAKGSNATITVLDALCNGDTTGQGTIIPTGYSPFTYAWDANTGNQTDSIATGLGAGTYYVTITDSLNCSWVDSAVVTEPSAISTNIVAMNVLCNGDSTGTANAITTGGTPGYTWLWDANTGNQTDSMAINLAAGTYQVSVTDSNNCVKVDSITITEPTAITASMSSTAQQTSGCDGDATATPSGGTPGYTYQWDSNANNQTDSTATGLCAGTYYVTITDDNGCTYVDSVTVDFPVGLNNFTASENFSVFPNPANDVVQVRTTGNGTLQLFNMNGKMVLQRRLVAGNNTLDISELATGLYSATLTNAKATEVIKLSIVR